MRRVDQLGERTPLGHDLTAVPVKDEIALVVPLEHVDEVFTVELLHEFERVVDLHGAGRTVGVVERVPHAVILVPDIVPVLVDHRAVRLGRHQRAYRAQQFGAGQRLALARSGHQPGQRAVRVHDERVRAHLRVVGRAADAVKDRIDRIGGKVVEIRLCVEFRAGERRDAANQLIRVFQLRLGIDAVDFHLYADIIGKAQPHRDVQIVGEKRPARKRGKPGQKSVVDILSGRRRQNLVGFQLQREIRHRHVLRVGGVPARFGNVRTVFHPERDLPEFRGLVQTGKPQLAEHFGQFRILAGVRFEHRVDERRQRLVVDIEAVFRIRLVGVAFEPVVVDVLFLHQSGEEVEQLVGRRFAAVRTVAVSAVRTVRILSGSVRGGAHGEGERRLIVRFRFRSPAAGKSDRLAHGAHDVEIGRFF